MSTRTQRGDADRRRRRRGNAGTTRRPAAIARQLSELDEGERVRRWRRGMRAAEERQRQLRAAEGPNPAQAVEECLSALSALDAMGMWPGGLDPISERQVDDVRRRWAHVQRRARAQAVRMRFPEDPALRAAIRRAVAQFQADVRRLARALPRTAASARRPRRRRPAARPVRRRRPKPDTLPAG